jgi:endonuclease III
MADDIHRLPGIGSKTARLIREELARVTASKTAPD